MKVNRQATIKNADDAGAFVVNLDSVKKVTANGHTSYVFSIQPATRHAVVFQNLTIDESAEGTKAFITRYTPTREWIQAWRKGRYIEFKGEIEIIPVGLASTGYKKKSGSPQTMVAQVCYDIAIYIPVGYPCNGDPNVTGPGGQHYPGESCPNYVNDPANAPYVAYQIEFVTECDEVPDGGEGGSGGGGTTLDPPPTYDPCEGSVPTLSSKGNKISVVEPTPCDEGDPDGPAPLDPTSELDYHYSGEEVNDSDPTNIADSSPKERIPSTIVLSNGKSVQIYFGVTDDRKSADQLVSKRLIDALKNALNHASQYVTITSLYVKATTNGKHAVESNHYKGLAIDISRINGQYIINLGANTLVTRLQEAFDQAPNRRENFGPAFKYKLGQPYNIGGHHDHVHFSVNGN